MEIPYYREAAEREYAKAYGRGRRLLRYSDEPSPWVVEFAESRHFRKVRQVADFACGEGINSVYLAGLGCKVAGFDIAAAAIRKARELAGRAGQTPRFCVGDMVSCPLPAASFDLALAMACFGRLLTDEHRLAFLDETARVLKSGGWLLFHDGILLEEVRLTFPEVFEELRRKRGDEEVDRWLEEEETGHYAPPSERYETRRGYEGLLERSGYRSVLSRLDVSAHGWRLVLWARKT